MYEKIVQLKLLSSDGKRYNTDVANTEQLLRIIQSIPSPKAEPFKMWLAVCAMPVISPFKRRSVPRGDLNFIS
ncbi:hypothetical protein KL86SPO_20213 [uncultured Sporomusa sp.]|uniref:Bro-N domain-containing protein n=1 Tax=uncultured Sporomusa sp. TaxID=307249 RepID=A0A212LMH2_9FIRM|nr:hypothetical protein KL86SPO_20213 [uncultured Sporomusa sp.]